MELCMSLPHICAAFIHVHSHRMYMYVLLLYILVWVCRAKLLLTKHQQSCRTTQVLPVMSLPGNECIVLLETAKINIEPVTNILHFLGLFAI